MGPPVEAFPASELPYRIQIDARGRRRKEHFDLRDCKLMELVQYDCEVRKRRGETGGGTIMCDPLVRLFRRCGDKVMVEVTDLEAEERRRLQEGRREGGNAEGRKSEVKRL